MAQVRSTPVVEARRNRTDTVSDNASSQWKAQCSLKRTISKCQLVPTSSPLDDAHKRKLLNFTNSMPESHQGLPQRRILTGTPCGRSTILSGNRAIRSRPLKPTMQLHGLVEPKARTIRMYKETIADLSQNVLTTPACYSFDVERSKDRFAKESTIPIWTATTTIFRHVTACVEKILSSYSLPQTITFEHLGQQIELGPLILLAIHSDISQFGLPFHIVERIISLFLDLFNNENFREANMIEWVSFLNSLETDPSKNVLHIEWPEIWERFYLQSSAMYGAMYAKFQAYLIDWWLASKKIAYPCEFGQKSAFLFLCMECHREHT
uniref:AlNc14C261G9808 protein n=1 Tax=Albugo laibachii Nc14 TaxID=890382 RepID=F0WCQ1_9STRA|nr:AlNc14C60G4432 [Albugo laibachii Nc14]CCA24829.1 AlNc14C261G9808 [Albugo laibachii Nc14]|eukprot:CCA24829.1 AlNc14C261G9808 [Albugo laibachii Nc14]